MAHNLEFNSGRGTTSFFSRKELAWHGLGQTIQEAVTAEEAIKLANLDYEVGLAPVFASFIPAGCITRYNTETFKFDMYENNQYNTLVSSLDKKGEIIKTNKAVYRKDTLTTLGIVGNKYTIVQNIESLEFIYNILKLNPEVKEKNDIIIETAGVLGQGERIFVTAKLPSGFKIGEEKDSTELYIVFTNSHDGTSSLTAMVTPIRVVCNNTLTTALGNNKSKVSFRHTANISNAMSQGVELLNISYTSIQRLKASYNALLHCKVDQNLIDELICKAMLNDNQLLQVQKIGMANVSKDFISTNLRNTMADMRSFIDSGVGQNTNRGTAYWAYMGMNTYLNNGVNYKDAESKFDSLATGTNSKLDSKILNTCLQLC
jgi:phage/plasmid-like protein (TIGR03299 family)